MQAKNDNIKLPLQKLQISVTKNNDTDQKLLNAPPQSSNIQINKNNNNDNNNIAITPTTISNSIKIQELLNKGNLNNSTNVNNTSNNATTSNTNNASSTNSKLVGAAAPLLPKTTGASAETPGISSTTTPTTALNDRFKSEIVRKNWKTVLDVALKKKNELIENEMNMNFNSALSNRSYIETSHEIYATDKENWIFFSIIISIVIILSVLFCFIVYWFFPQFRARHFW